MVKTDIDKLLKIDSAKAIVDELIPLIKGGKLEDLLVIWVDKEGDHIRGTVTNTEAVGHLEVMKHLMIDDALCGAGGEE